PPRLRPEVLSLLLSLRWLLFLRLQEKNPPDVNQKTIERPGRRPSESPPERIMDPIPANGLTEVVETAPDLLDAALEVAFGPPSEVPIGLSPTPYEQRPALRLREPYPRGPEPGSAAGDPHADVVAAFGMAGRYQIEGELARGGMG